MQSLLAPLLRGLRLFHVGSGHALRWSFKALVFAYFAFCILFLALRYAVLPNIDRYKGTVEQVATKAVGRPVAIGTIVASWHGLNPRLLLNDVVIYNRMGERALSLPRVSATVSWWSLALARLRLESLEVLRPDLEIERDAEGDLFVGGIYIDPRSKGEGGGLDWLLQQPQIVVRDGWVRWKDARRGAPELVLSQMTVVLENKWLQHRIAVRATPPSEIGAPLDVRAAFSHSPFAQRISDVSGWDGMLYVDWQQADLARGKTWIDYPVQVDRGRGGVRAWMSFDNATVTDLTADLALTDLSARLRPDLEMLNLVRVQGRVSAGETVPAGAQRLFNFGRRGHSVALTDFAFETADGLVLPPTTLTERYTEASGNKPSNTELKAASLDLQALASFASRLPLGLEQRQLLSELAPRGRLLNFSAGWQGDYPQVKAYQVKGDFTGLSLRAQPRPAPAGGGLHPGIPGFTNLSGSVDLNEGGGELKLASSDATVELPGIFAQPNLGFERLDIASRWTIQPERKLQLFVSSASFVHEGMHGSLSGRYVLGLNHKDRGYIDMHAQLEEGDISRTGRYLPLNTPPSLVHWLSGALKGGKLREASVVLKGNLADFPFRSGRANEKPRGEFSVTGRLVDARLDYAPADTPGANRKPLWPLIENINGKLGIDRTRLDVHADSAQSHKVDLTNVEAVVPDLLASSPQLTVTGNAQGALQELLGFTNDSPVGEWIGHFTEDSRASGNAKLALNLQLPLHELPQTKVRGSLQFNDNDVVLLTGLPTLSRTRGELRFNEKGFDLAGIRAGFLGGPVTLNGGTQKDGQIAVRAEGTASVDGLRRNYPAPSMQRLFQRVSGSTRYSVQVNLRNKQPDIVVESSLAGVALDFPAPLKKAAGDTMPLRVELAGLPDEEGGARRDEIRATLGNTVNVRHLRRKADKNSDWQVVHGGIGVNVPAPQPESGVVINANVRSLDLDAWRATMSSIAGEGGAAAGASGGGAGGTSGNHLNLSQYADPQVLAARAGELLIGNKKLDNVVVGASHADGVWQANIESSQVSGYVSWQESRSGRGRGRVTARLASLIVPPSAAGDVSDLLEGKGSATIIPALDVVAENFELFNKKFGRLELQAHNAATPDGREWRINKLAVSNPDANMAATGKYVFRDGQSQSSLDYQLDVADAGRLLDRLGYPGVLRGGRGRLTGQVGWKGLPFSFDLPSLSGQLEMDIAAGQFLKVDPGAAKLLGVLSLQSLPRRLALDFRDVFSEGFAFDGATGRATIEQGVMKTDSFKMRSVSALVLMDGAVDLTRESQNLHVVVIPEINAGSASLAYGLVNPVLGLGSFLAQLFLRDPLMRAFTQEYEISGPWKDPNIRKLARPSGGSNEAGREAAPPTHPKS